MDITHVSHQHTIQLNITPDVHIPVDTPGTDSAVLPDEAHVRQTTGNEENEYLSKTPDHHPMEDMFSKALTKANKQLEPMSVEFQINYHEKTGYVNVKVINSETKEVVREIPSQKALDMLAKIWELAGIMVDDRK